jgi:hypothetical protein
MCFLGYGAKRRAHDPDYEHVENAKYREYERLESEGYDDSIKDPEDNRPNIKKVRLGAKYRYREYERLRGMMIDSIKDPEDNRPNIKKVRLGTKYRYREYERLTAMMIL